MKREVGAVGVIAILFTAGGIYFGAQKSSATTPYTSAMVQLWSQSLPDAKGQIQALSQWKGKTLLVNFWATWCAPCVQEMPELSALQTEIASKNMQIIGIGIDSPANIAEFSLKYKIGYPVYSAGMDGSELSRQFGNQTGGIPYTVLITPDGHIKKTYSGRLTMASLRKDLGLF